MGNVVIVRPGCTDYDEQHRIQGCLDLPLSPRGEEQVLRIVERLREIPLDVIYTSTCEPARSTAHAIGEALGLPVKEQEGFRNLRQGLWEGLQVEELRRKSPRVFRQWQDSPETICPPGGEPVADAIERLREALVKPIRKRQRFVVVASEPLATLICCLLKQCRPETPDFEDVCDDAARVDIIDLDCRGEGITVFPAKQIATAELETNVTPPAETGFASGSHGDESNPRASESSGETSGGTSPTAFSNGAEAPRNGSSNGVSHGHANGSTHHRLAMDSGTDAAAMTSLNSTGGSGL